MQRYVPQAIMSETESSTESVDGDGDIIMRQPRFIKIQKYKITLNTFYEHTYERQYNDTESYNQEYDDDTPDSVDGYVEDGTPEKCNDDACSCSGDEYPPEPDEYDAFMKAPYCGKQRYDWFTISVMGKFEQTKESIGVEPVQDITYTDGGKITFTFYYKARLGRKPPSAERLKQHLLDRCFENEFYEGCPGNEAIMPTKHKYSYTVGLSFDTKYTELERGRIDCRRDDAITVECI